MPKKFSIDKRIITYSAQVLTGQITREQAIEKIRNPPYDSDQMERDKEFVLKKLDLSKEEFEKIWNQGNKYYWGYPSNMPIIKKYLKVINAFHKSFFTNNSYHLN